MLECTRLVQEIKRECGQDAKKRKKKGLEEAEVWLEEANRRKEGAEKREKIKKQRQILALIDKEDENLVISARRIEPHPPPYVQASAPAVPDTGAGEGTPPARAETPPLKHRLRGAKAEANAQETSKWSELNPFSPKSLTAKKIDMEEAETYPMIAVPNPREGAPILYVYRPWTVEDVKKATEGIPHPKLKVTQWETDIRNLYASYRLNGAELERAIRQTMGPDWCVISGNWNPNAGDGEPLAYNHGDLNDRLTALIARATNRYHTRADWTEINRCVQREDEDTDMYFARLKEIFDMHSGITPPANADDSPYEQQLKNAYLKGSLVQISSFVTKHMLNHRTARLNDVREYCKHAEQHFRTKKKGRKGQSMYLTENEGIFLMSEHHGNRGRRRGRGRGRGRKGGADRGACYVCGKTGHWARECPHKKTAESEASA